MTEKLEKYKEHLSTFKKMLSEYKAFYESDGTVELAEQEMLDKLLNAIQLMSNKIKELQSENSEESDTFYDEIDDAYQYDGASIDTYDLSPQRKQIVKNALSELGNGIFATVRAEKDDSNNYTRKGWKKLTEIFKIAYGGKIPKGMPAVIKYHKYGKHSKTNTNGLQSWCGIFCVYVLKKSGVSCPNWKIGGVALSKKTAPKNNVKPGDIGIVNGSLNHHCVVVKVDGDNIISVDGNMGPDSTMVIAKRNKSVFNKFYQLVND